MIPIIPPEQVEVTSIDLKKVRKEKTKTEKGGIEKGEIPITEGEEEEDVLTKIVGEMAGEEGDIEGKEEEILKKVLEEIEKEEKQRGIKRRQKERKERRAIHVGPLFPGLVTAEKEHIHEKSVVPIGDSCCNKLCKHLNDEIFDKEESLGATAKIYVRGQIGEFHRSFPSIPYTIEALKDYRYLLHKDNVCKCYEETKEIEAPLPVIGGEPQKLISSRTGKPVTTSLRYELPKSMMHIVHRKDKPTVPTQDDCCAKACEMLTKKIRKMENMIDEMELRSGKSSRPILGSNLRYEALVFKTFALQEYRLKLTKNKTCECIK